jgi:hypothetical protein
MKRQEDYLVASLLDFFRHIENETKWFQAAKIALNQVERMANLNASPLEKSFIFFASKLKNNISPASLRFFAHECISRAAKIRLITAPCDSVPMQTSSAYLRKKARHNITKSLSTGHSESASILRAANSLRAESAHTKLVERRAQKIHNHPLRDTLEALNTNTKKIAKEDIRNHFINLKNFTSNNKQQGVLFGILKKAQAFNTSHLHELLGDELFHLCRPLGFLDKNDTTIIIEVPSSAHLHALTYRKLDILRALKQDPCFNKARYIKFKIKSTW